MSGGLSWELLQPDPSCVCQSSFGHVVGIDVAPVAQTMPGMAKDDMAILAGVLTGLATFLFLALPILCCLCPWPCCAAAAAKKKKAAAAAAAAAAGGSSAHNKAYRSSEVESVKSYRSFDKEWDKGGKGYDFDNLYEVDMKLPRAWVNSLKGDDKEDQWEGSDMRAGSGEQLETYAGNDTLERAGTFDRGSRMYEQTSTLDASGNFGGGMGGAGSFAAGAAAGARRGEGEIVEYETTRTLHIETAAAQLPEQEYIYEKELRQELNGSERDNFMKMYSTVRSLTEDKQTSF